MKKLLWCAGLLVTIIVIVAVIIGRKPDNQIVALTKSSGKEYEEIMVLKRNRTYEQLMRRESDGIIFSHEGTWLPAKEDPASYSLMQETHQGSVENYITIKDKVFHNDKIDKTEAMDLIEPVGMDLTPNEKVLSLYKQWRAEAKPLVLPAKKGRR